MLPLLPSALSPDAFALGAELLGLRLPATARGVFIPRTGRSEDGVLLRKKAACWQTACFFGKSESKPVDAIAVLSDRMLVSDAAAIVTGSEWVQLLLDCDRLVSCLVPEVAAP